jgi:hypothetical protein
MTTIKENINHWVNHSAYGKAHENWNDVWGRDSSLWHLISGSNPQLVQRVPEVQLMKLLVLGSPFSGKSTLWEHFTNQKIFTRANFERITTWCPIVLQKRNSPIVKKTVIWRDETYDCAEGEQLNARVMEILEELGKVGNYVNEILLVKIEGPDQANMEIIDLPGNAHSSFRNPFLSELMRNDDDNRVGGRACQTRFSQTN